MFARLRDEYGDVVHFRTGPLDMHLVTDPELVHQVFTTHAGSVRKGRIPEGGLVMMPPWLLHRDGRQWSQPTGLRSGPVGGRRAARAPPLRLERLPGHHLELSPQITLRPAGGLPMHAVVR